MEFKHIENVAIELKALLEEWETKKAPLPIAKKELMEAEKLIENSYDMDSIKQKNEAVKKVGYTLSDIEEALKRWQKSKLQAVEAFDISGKLKHASELDELANKGRLDDMERLNAYRDEFIANVRPIVEEMASVRVEALTKAVNDFDYIMKIRNELVPTDTRAVKFAPYENFYTGTLVHDMMENIKNEISSGIVERPIFSRY